MLHSGTDPESYITEYILICEDYLQDESEGIPRVEHVLGDLHISQEKIIKLETFWQCSLLHSMFFTSNIEEFVQKTSLPERF